MKNYPNQYPHLFSPITIKNTTFKNRIESSPHSGIIFLDAGINAFNDCGFTNYGNRARGGAGIVTTMETKVDPDNGCAHSAHLDLTTEAAMQTLPRLTTYIHRYGAIASVEITHRGKYAVPEWNHGNLPVGPSDCINPDGVPVHGLTEEEMFALAEKFATATERAKRAGFDMACIHGAHSWLLNQFLSPVENKRTDKYGGSLENRARFPIMVIDAIRKAVGEDFILEYRISTDEMVEGGMTVEDSIQFVKMIDEKIDIIHCSTGSKLNDLSRGTMQPSRFRPHGCNVHLAEAVKKSGVKCKVTAVGAIDDPALADQIIAEGKADFVAMVRAFIADKDWGEKARAGKADEIRPCIKCLRCLDDRGGLKRVACTVNPEEGNWDILHKFFPKNGDKKSFAIVGGGPAGMEAALCAAQSGHKVTLFEKTDKLGGQLLHADGVEFKRRLANYRDWLIRQVEKSNIEVRYNTLATPELLDEGYYDAIIVGVGADPIIPRIPGIDGKNVMVAGDALDSSECVGKRVVVVGGGGIGCETALHFAQLDREVVIVEMLDKLAADFPKTERTDTLDLVEKSCSIMLNTKCVGIDETGVTLSLADGSEKHLDADTVVISAGMRPKAAERDAFLNHAYDVIPVGDCVKPGNLFGAIHSAYDAVLRIDTRCVNP